MPLATCLVDQLVERGRVCGVGPGDEAIVRIDPQFVVEPPVIELGEMPDGRPFFAMKLIEGRTLSDLLQERSRVADAADYRRHDNASLQHPGRER